MKIPLNRLVAFAGPYISLAAGALAALLFAKLNVLGIPGLTQDALTEQIAAGLSLALGAGLTWLGHQSWLKGHHIELATAIAPPTVDADAPPTLAVTPGA